MRKRKVWCEEKDVGFGWIMYSSDLGHLEEKVKKYTSLIRCKKCKKRFRGFLVELEPGLLHARFPKHKRYLKKSEQ